jgi:3-phenylpropionate/trans-cinnamate dioxygenase ferredoxin subunit
MAIAPPNVILAMPDFEKTIKASDLPEGTMKIIQLNGKSVLLANIDGRIYGMGGICTHSEWDLSEGSLRGTKIICGGHGAVWDLQTGKAEFTEPIDDEPLYEVMTKDEYLYVEKK